MLAGLKEGGQAGYARTATLPSHLHAHAMRILRAAESAIRALSSFPRGRSQFLPRQVPALSLSAALNAQMAETKFGVFRM